MYVCNVLNLLTISRKKMCQLYIHTRSGYVILIVPTSNLPNIVQDPIVYFRYNISDLGKKPMFEVRSSFILVELSTLP